MIQLCSSKFRRIVFTAAVWVVLAKNIEKSCLNTHNFSRRIFKKKKKKQFTHPCEADMRVSAGEGDFIKQNLKYLGDELRIKKIKSF